MKNKRFSIIRGFSVSGRASWLLLILVVIILAACAPRHPLGIDDKDWQTLSPQQRLDALEQQAQLDLAQEQRRIAEARQREAQARQQEAEAARQRAELEKLRCEARYGDRIQCVLDQAEVYRSRRWEPIESLAFDLVRHVELTTAMIEQRHRQQRTIGTVYALFDGQTVSLCDRQGADSGRRQCLRLVGVFEDYRRGIRQQLVAPEFLRGELRCSLAPAEGMPLQLMINR